MSALYGFELGDDCSSKLALGSGKAGKTPNGLRDAPGYIAGYQAPAIEGGNASSAEMEAMQETMAKMKKKRMMAHGQSPGKNLLMTGFMLWMSGSGLNIFSIMMTGMALWNPIKSLVSLNSSFAPFRDTEGLMQAKLMFVFLNGVGLSFALYKLAQMGLVPMRSTDWVALLQTSQAEEMLSPIPSISY
ncbi:ER membrane protein complex subunit 4 [Hondaea fermentalgiana]|uniref:ER membrane protein complex subunit 4 n=1 Tax=Hondaea fermentalgiana TaxID=2315210 RepID=A0A2R5GPD2_9STRA|nr:ER membrane protein complex subunit 4 [Hondaea fermentalgiana]|eukprot:GBG32475.1 ER membrane protein complex subunit 4 [Hondaea fermentalgiana]